jgi:hypothetical protein
MEEGEGLLGAQGFEQAAGEDFVDTPFFGGENGPGVGHGTDDFAEVGLKAAAGEGEGGLGGIRL